MRITTRVWAAGCVAVAALVAAGGYLVGVEPQLDHAAQTALSAQAVEGQADTTQARIGALTKVAAKQSQLESQAAVLRRSMPSTLQSNTFIKRVNEVAALDAVTVQSITAGAPVAYQPQPAAAAAAAATAAAAAAAAAPAATPTPSASAPVSASGVTSAAAPILAVTDPSITAANLTVIPMTVVVQGSSAAGMQFLKDMQNDQRLYLISGFNSGADQDDPTAVTTTLVGSIYAVKG